VNPRRLGLLGGECTGKTSLALALADALPGFIAEEYLRDFVRDFNRVPMQADQEGIFLTQQMTVHTVLRAAAHSSTPWVIADPLPLMTAVYSIVYFSDDSLLATGIADAAAYDVLLWCAPDVPWTPDGAMRDGEEFRARTEEVLADLVVPALAAAGAPMVQRLTGSLAERLHQALPPT